MQTYLPPLCISGFGSFRYYKRGDRAAQSGADLIDSVKFLSLNVTLASPLIASEMTA